MGINKENRCSCLPSRTMNTEFTYYFDFKAADSCNVYTHSICVDLWLCQVSSVLTHQSIQQYLSILKCIISSKEPMKIEKKQSLRVKNHWTKRSKYKYVQTCKHKEKGKCSHKSNNNWSSIWLRKATKPVVIANIKENSFYELVFWCIQNWNRKSQHAHG